MHGAYLAGRLLREAASQLLCPRPAAEATGGPGMGPSPAAASTPRPSPRFLHFQTQESRFRPVQVAQENSPAPGAVTCARVSLLRASPWRRRQAGGSACGCVRLRVALPHTSGDRHGTIALFGVRWRPLSLGRIARVFRALRIGGGWGRSVLGHRCQPQGASLRFCPINGDRPRVLGGVLSRRVVCSPERRCCSIALQTRSRGKSLRNEVLP